MTSPRRLRVFLASPGDVGEERAIARQILAELPYDALVNWRVVFEVVAWDQPRSGPPMLATMTPQAAIAAGMPKPSECDVVVVIVWSRMGTPLPATQRKPDGSPYRSGTEWEYLEARSAADKTGKPLVLVYRRTEPCRLEPADPHYEERRAQQEQVEAFFAEFRNLDGSIRYSSKEYSDPADFRRVFEDNMKVIVKREITWADSQPDSGTAPAASHDKAPQSSTTTPVFVGPTARGPLEPQLVIGWDDFVQTYGEPLSAGVSYLGHAVRGFFDNGGGRAYVVRVVGAGAAAASVMIPSASGGDAFGFDSVSVGAWGNRLGIRVRKGTRVGIRITVVEDVSDEEAGTKGERTLEDWDNLSLDPAAKNFTLRVVAEGRRSRWVRCRAGQIHLDPVAEGATAWLSGGTDGAAPTAEDYLGTWPPEEAESGLRATAGFEDVALVCIPDHVHERLAADDRTKLALETVALSERLRYRFALLSVQRGREDPESITPLCDSAYAALYAPWVHVEEFGGEGTTWVPPVGHVAGIFARCDLEHGIHHAPVGEVVRGLARDSDDRSIEFDYDAAQRDTLVRLGVNALGVDGGQARTLTALTTSTIEEYQSLAAQRFLAWILESIDCGTRWAKFEANDEALWRRLTEEISAFLESVWSSGGLLGSTPQEAFRVKCDAETTTQNDVDNGRASVVLRLALAEPRGALVSPTIMIEAGQPSVSAPRQRTAQT